MQLAKIQLARSIWLFDVQELNPTGLSVASGFDNKFAERYNFKRLPKPEELSTGSASWGDGRFSFKDEHFDLAVQIHPDGVVADTRYNTDMSDLFIFDFIEWAATELQSPRRPRIRKRSYRSEIVLYANRGLAGLCDKLDSISNAVGGMLQAPQEVSAIMFGSSTNIANFTFERRLNTPFEDNAFFSAALLTTSGHMELLSQIENMLEPELIEQAPEQPKEEVVNEG